MVEGGANVISTFLASGLVDLVLITIAPVYVGLDGVSAVQNAEVILLSIAFNFQGVLSTRLIVSCSFLYAGCANVWQHFVSYLGQRYHDGRQASKAKTLGI